MKLLRIKWENILFIMYEMFYTRKTILYIEKYGWDAQSEMTMFLIFNIILFIIYMMTYKLRRSLLEKEKK